MQAVEHPISLLLPTSEVAKIVSNTQRRLFQHTESVRVASDMHESSGTAARLHMCTAT